MAGLMVIFLFIFITYIRDNLETQKYIRSIVVTWNETEVDIYKSLFTEFEGDLDKWNAEIDRETLSIRFKAPDVLFDAAKATLKPRFRDILADFFPRYMRVLYGYKDAIEEVRIEGHTSSEWEGARSAEEAYFRNMDLSQARTRSVLEYCLQLADVAPLKDWARANITANGLSSSKLIVFVDGREDKARSRRVEFRIRTKTKERIVEILEKFE
jgi:outer membrane protein OmpA-like peptidoglycan-associated protein